MVERFFPDARAASAYDVPYESLYEEGYRGIVFDIDNTLVGHGAPADARAEGLFARLKKMGYRTCLLSNNQRKRVEMFNQNIGAKYICNAMKPLVRNYRRAMVLMGTNRENTFFVGDQLFTDVWGAKRAGIYGYLVRPLYKEETLQVRLKRGPEKLVLRAYERRNKK